VLVHNTKNVSSKTYNNLFSLLINYPRFGADVIQDLYNSYGSAVIFDESQMEDASAQSTTLYDILKDDRLSVTNLAKIQKISDFQEGLDEIITAAIHYKKQKASDKPKAEMVVRNKVLTEQQSKFLVEALSSLPAKETLSWGLVNKALNINQQPKMVQLALIKLKTPQGTVNSAQLTDTINSLIKGDPSYD
jgi:hypothetical protein